MKVLYQDEKNNRVMIADDNDEFPIGDLRYTFKSFGATLIIGSAVKFLSCNVILDENCEIIIEDNCFIRGKLFAARTSSRIKIGKGTKCNASCRFHADEGKSIIIGERCLFSNVRFRTSDSHSIITLDSGLRLNYAKDIVIGDNVWMAEDVNVYKGVTVGSGSVVGARSTVTRDLPSNSLCVGTPAIAVKSNITWSERLLK